VGRQSAGIGGTIDVTMGEGEISVPPFCRDITEEDIEFVSLVG
jgi:hypothetical protein